MENGVEKRDFFISYTHSDKEWALWVARVLQNNGYTVYMQETDILPGDSFLTKMNYFLENSENVIAVWSESYNNSYFGMMELEAAVAAKMRVLFCRVDNHPVSKLYGRLVHVALSDMDAASEAKLIDAVRFAVPPPAPEQESPTPEKPLDSKPSKPIGGKARKSEPTVLELMVAFVVLFAMLFSMVSLIRQIASHDWEPYPGTRAYYEKEIAQGNVEAWYHLGWLYQNGLDGDIDYAEARECYERAAEEGDAAALNQLGQLYHNAWGVERDYAKAREYYEQAADKGNSAALYNLGVVYFYGLGVDIDYEKAWNYYQQSADAGYEIASAAMDEFRATLDE